LEEEKRQREEEEEKEEEEEADKEWRDTLLKLITRGLNFLKRSCIVHEKIVGIESSPGDMDLEAAVPKRKKIKQNRSEIHSSPTRSIIY